MNLRMSPEIFRLLMSGKMINQSEYNTKTNEFEDNPFYQEIIGNFGEYEKVYRAIGYELKPMGCSYFIREYGLKTYDDNAMQAMVLLDCINRGMTLKGINPTVIRERNIGLPYDHLRDIAEDPAIKVVLKGCGLKPPLENNVDNGLVAKGLAHNVGGKLVLSDAGLCFMDELIEHARYLDVETS